MSDNQENNQKRPAVPRTCSMTQQGAFRKDRNALISAEKKGFTDRQIINKMADAHSRPDSSEAIIESAGAVLHLRANMRRESPVHDAYKALCADAELSIPDTSMEEEEAPGSESETKGMPPYPA